MMTNHRNLWQETFAANLVAGIVFLAYLPLTLWVLPLWPATGFVLLLFCAADYHMIYCDQPRRPGPARIA